MLKEDSLLFVQRLHRAKINVSVTCALGKPNISLVDNSVLNTVSTV